MINKLSERHSGDISDYINYTVKCPCCGIVLNFGKEDGTYIALYRYTIGSPVITKKESAIDAAFKMACWLLENNKI